MDNNVLFKVGTYEEYQALEQKNPNALYWITDTNEIYKGDKLYGSGRYATETNGGLLSAEDKIKLNNLSGGSVAGLVPVDASIVIGQGEDGTKTIGVQISKESGNIISVKNDGLFVSALNAEYTIEKLGNGIGGVCRHVPSQKDRRRFKLICRGRDKHPQGYGAAKRNDTDCDGCRPTI